MNFLSKYYRITKSGFRLILITFLQNGFCTRNTYHLVTHYVRCNNCNKIHQQSESTEQIKHYIHSRQRKIQVLCFFSQIVRCNHKVFLDLLLSIQYIHKSLISSDNGLIVLQTKAKFAYEKLVLLSWKIIKYITNWPFAYFLFIIEAVSSQSSICIEPLCGMGNVGGFE